MTKLLVLDKDGTLVHPKSGNTFVQHPEDQELIEGVAEAIARYVADGWTIAIASNQGGCEKRYSKLYEVPIGAFIEIDGKPVKCESRYLDSDRVIFNGEEVIGNTDSEAAFRYKTIDMAIAEMRYAMTLTGIQKAFFCPDMGGNQCYVVGPAATVEIGQVSPHTRGSYRKPCVGMLAEAMYDSICEYLDSDERATRGIQVLMIGDRQEDFISARDYGANFMWAHEWIALNS
jgi:D-glycero-D-manno-heptose 1,7-bisphosphate phosphatase